MRVPVGPLAEMEPCAPPCDDPVLSEDRPPNHQSWLVSSSKALSLLRVIRIASTFFLSLVGSGRSSRLIRSIAWASRAAAAERADFEEKRRRQTSCGVDLCEVKSVRLGWCGLVRCSVVWCRVI